ncbi:hypothetical protein [uncultured Cellulomonas sp.]|uniref:hypothetical protein n=1 Tax=uncultured Cellulomonas sp. TaxID=189682 RepID=UPI0028E32F79|nr:hypothetical protein [uncultured Cellulomonas sp.]
MPIRTNRALLTALGLATVLWFASAAAHAAATRAGVAPGVVGLLAPATPAVSMVRGASPAGAWDVAAVVAFLGTLAVLVLPALRATRTGTAARVLAVWFAAIVAGWAAAFAWTVVVAMPMIDYGLTTLLAMGFAEGARAGCAWGVTYGWVVALVTVAVARLGQEPANDAHRPGALAAGITAGAVAAIGWLVVAAAHVRIDDTVNQYVTTARSQFASMVRAGADWLLPVTTTAGASGGVVLLSGVLVGGVVGTLAWLAARTSVLPGGRLVLVLGVWAAAIVGAAVGGLPGILTTVELEPEGDGWWAVQQLLLFGPTDGGASGALYGWIPALLALGVLAWAARGTHPAAEEPAPAIG